MGKLVLVGADVLAERQRGALAQESAGLVECGFRVGDRAEHER